MSAKACSGILRRAAARKKLATMPELLRLALEDVAKNGAPKSEIDAPIYATSHDWPKLIALTLNAAFGEKLGLEDQHALSGAGLSVAVCATGDHTHTLTAEGFDASEDGTGRGTPIVAFGSKDHGADASFDVCPTLRAGGHHKSHANAGVPPAIAYASPARYFIRRLTPAECARLQGIPDDHCRVTHRGKPAADGPIYKAIGNGMAAPVIRDLLDRAGGRPPPPRGAALAFCVANAKEPKS
ncbi:MAG: DNA cytosine methyltransferase [Microgenomates group bacterium]